VIENVIINGKLEMKGKLVVGNDNKLMKDLLLWLHGYAI